MLSEFFTYNFYYVILYISNKMTTMQVGIYNVSLPTGYITQNEQE